MPTHQVSIFLVNLFIRLLLCIAGKVYSNAHFGAGSGKVWLEDVACTTSKTKLLQCSSSPIGQETCSHSDDAGVGCEGMGKATMLW